MVANVAIARDLGGWCWSLAVFEEQSDPRVVNDTLATGHLAEARGARPNGDVRLTVPL